MCSQYICTYLVEPIEPFKLYAKGTQRNDYNLAIGYLSNRVPVSYFAAEDSA